MQVFIRCIDVANFIRKNQEVTVHEIYEHFQGKGYYSKIEANAKRAIQRDLKEYIPEYVKAEIIKKPKKRYAIRFREEEMFKISYKNLNFLSLNSELRREFNKYISLDIRNFRHLDKLEYFYNAINNKKRLKFEYTDYLDNSRNVELSVYGLKENDNRWYAIGENHLKQDENGINEIYRFALDRVNSIEETIYESNRPEAFEIEKIFENLYGIVFESDEPHQRNQGSIPIVFFAEPRQASYIISTPLHHSQEYLHVNNKENGEDGTIFKLQVANTYDLRMRFLSYAHKAVILEPECFRNDVVKMLEDSLRNYHDKPIFNIPSGPYNFDNPKK
ncbi:helix-turn-helix transcriptional regulator [Aureivirga sp. CE67]|uniref:helix-turn-helix transcriptional regulator n=1 Tax=Aureivirga sp. CE67 TaxID=1788983 RepID=UPI0018CA8375|nr:WYL domain-containing protein [Aureivirga sp. CE67]